MKSNSIIKQIAYALITIFLVLVFNYFLFRVLPGNPLAMLMRNPKATEAMIESMRQLYGLDQPWYVQFFLYFKDMLSGDFGTSFIYKAPVMEVIGARILPTVLMLGLAELLAIFIGIFLGIISA